MSADEAGH